ncbi:MAG: MarR family transcriptional regulator [Acidimicrobiia bacterium]|nr:MarR family transcriptional regulator [Acidimicrobiia bacterium]
MTVTTTELERTAALCDDSAIHAYGVTVEATTRLNRSFDRRLRSECDITLAWFEALLRVGRHGGSMTMSELAGQLSLTNGGVTRLVDKMAEAGYLRREPCEHDRRVSYAVLTDAGVAKWREASLVHIDDLRREFVDRMSSEELETVVRVMDRIRQDPDSPL